MPAKPDPNLAHHFEDLGQQHEAATLGMWVFLATELMFFGGLFTGYTIYRSQYPAAFAAASNHLSVWIGGINTIVLLTSSLTMALAVHAAQTGARRTLVAMLLATAGLGSLFLAIKAYEYYVDYEEGLVPVLHFKAEEFQPSGSEARPLPVRGLAPEELREDGNVAQPAAAPRDRYAMPTEAAASFARRVELFLMFYYIMTGIHAVHLIIGIALMLILAHKAQRGRYAPEFYYPIEVGGLYWHFVDVIWIFLLPLLYLIGGSH